MADLQHHDTVCSSSSPPPEPDEFSLLLHQVLLRSSSFSSPSHSNSMPFLISPLPDNNNNIPYRPTPPAESSSSAWNVFPTSAPCFPPPPATVLSSSSVGNTDNDLDDQHDCESEDGYEAMIEDPQPNLASARNYSKRSRAAEIHNLSEKRRRSRINEKMKALQKLIPNSNKTDKASMLDEAIEYLKQLQLQVQMLTMRNGLSLYPPELPPAAVLGRGLQSNNQVSHFRRSFGHENGSSSSDILHEHGLNSQTNHLAAAPYHQHHQYQTEDDALASFSKQRNVMVHATDQRSSIDFQMGGNFKDGLESTAPLSENSIFFDATFEWPEHRRRSYR